MNLKTAADQLVSLTSGIGIHVSRLLKAIWSYMNFDLVENIFSPRRRVFVALDKDSISVAYGSRFFGKSRIHVCRKYAFERKQQENISRKYIYQDGQFPKPEVVVSTLDYFVSEFKAQHAKVILSLPKAWTVYRTVEFPVAVLDNIKDVISYELDRLLSLNAENSYFDFKTVGRNQDNIKVSIAAARKDLVDSYIRPLEEKGLDVEKVTTNLSAAGALLRYLYGRQCFVLADVYKDEYEISAISDGVVLSAHKGRYTIEDRNEIIQLIADELISFCEDLTSQEQPTQVVICSEEEYFGSLREKIDLPVQMMRRSNLLLDYKGETREADFLTTSACLELLSGNMSSINLLSQNNEAISSQAFKFSIILAVVAVVFGILSLIAPLGLEEVKIYQMDRLMDNMKEDFRKNEPQKNELETVLYQIRATNEFKNSKPPRILLLRELSDMLPAQFWISRMTMTENTLEIEMQGKGAHGEVASILEASPHFGNVRRLESGEQNAEKDPAKQVSVFKMDIVNKPVDGESRK